MRTLLFGVILGLLMTPGYSLPVNGVTETGASDAEEEDVLREAVTDGFIVGYAFPTAATSESPGSNATATATQRPDSRQPPTDEAEEEGSVPSTSDESDPAEASGMFEGSADVLYTTPWEVTSSQAPTTLLTSTSHSSTEAHTLLGSDSISITTQGYTSPASESHTGPGTTTVSVTLTPSLISDIRQHTVTEEHDVTDSTTSSATLHVSTSTTTVSNIIDIVPRIFKHPESGKELENNIIPGASVEQPQSVADPGDNTTSKQEDRRSSSWMIITAFVIGIVAMVVVLVAIATRDRWRGAPKQVSKAEESNKANGSNQQRELEMETFLEKGTPKEDMEEYTVIPLNELLEKQPLQ